MGEVSLHGLTGVIIVSIPENSKEIGNSITQLFYNLIGYLPSPFIYGLVCKYTGGSQSRWGLAVLVLWGILGVFSLFFARKYDFDYYLIENVNEMENQENIKEYFLNKEETNENGEKKENLQKSNFLIRKSTGDLPIINYNFKEKSTMITKLFGRISQL